MVVEALEKEVVAVPTEIQKLLDSFPIISKELYFDSLPPHRDIDHRIDLILGSILRKLPHYRTSPRETDLARSSG